MKTPEELQTEYDQLDIKPDKTDWMIQQLSDDIEQTLQATKQQPSIDLILNIQEQHVQAMLTYLLQIVMAAAPTETVEQAVEDFAKYALLDKLSRMHKILSAIVATKSKLIVPKLAT